MGSEEVQVVPIGASVRVRGAPGGAPGLPFGLRGLTGTVSAKWGDPWGGPQDLILEVRLEDGRTRLFWHHELEGVAEGAP